MPLKYVVFDEAHVWKGVMGAGISLLITRLRKFYGQNNPRFILASATIDNPDQLGRDLTGSDEVATITFTPDELISPAQKVDFGRILSCSMPELLQSLSYIGKIDSNTEKLAQEKPSLQNAIRMLRLLNLISDATEAALTTEGEVS